ncbi:MAG: tripartite tricarboxylate transporter substrate binding protein [Betaproteobacteria bacterium]|nr:tripartite tricarboxylate transporter substrate binding protein [Betaproteobacteria bacterium]
MHKSLTTAAILFTLASIASAQQFPAKPIRIIIPFPPGGIGDLTGRVISQKLSENIGQSVIIENRPGGDEIIGSELLVRSAPDGYTLLMPTAAHAVNPNVRKKLPFDPVKDFAPVTLATQFPYLIVVHPSVPAKSLKELLAYAKAHPDKLTYGTSATLPNLATGWLVKVTGIRITHVPYKGAGPVLVDLIGGHLDSAFAAPVGPMPFIQSGRLKAVAVTSRTRSAFLPNVPTVIEAGIPDYEVLGWNGVLAPAATPREIILRLNTELVNALKAPEVREQFSQRAMQTVGNSAEEFARFMAAETVKWHKAAQLSGIKPE